jgi:HAD superfamily hydrolase (TIGR01509 family)
VLFPGVAELIGNAASQYRVALLSNTNEIHWRQVTAASRLFDEFEHVFLSYETGHYKPEPAAFHDVTEYFDCAPGDIIFLDDSAPNITAARDLGIDARLVAGVSELERELLGVADCA